ncbi:MAG: hypothetical protein PHW34_13555 [Hespellia sp.]|nr:hypothetical protein [Hespellia sp.]
MKNELFIPACHKYIKRKDGLPDSQRIFSVAKTAYKSKYPDQVLDNELLFHFLKTNAVISEQISFSDIDYEYVELCFSIISQYKCNTICQLCAYSPLYRNQYENEESMLLGYALNSWKNLHALLDSGLTCRHFRSMIPVSEKSSILVAPLNRLAFEYMEKIPKNQEDMLSIADKIMAALKENNKNKLTAADFKIMGKYLVNLANGNYQKLDSSSINNILKKCYKLSFQNPEQKEQTAPPSTCSNQKPAPNKEPKPTYLDGFLSGKPTGSARDRKLPQETSGKKQVQCKPTNPPALPQTPIRKSEQQKTVTEIPINSIEKKPQNRAALEDQKTLTSYRKSSVKKISKASNPLERTPRIWKLKDTDLNAPLYYNLEKTDKYHLERFYNALLLTPVLPMEIVAGTNSEWVLMYVKNQIYYFSTCNLTILDNILPYIHMSRYRKIVCYEPYLLYDYFHQQSFHNVLVFSLRHAMDIVLPLSYWGVSPSLALDCLEKSKNLAGEQEVIFCMKRYYNAYRVLHEKVESLEEKKITEYQIVQNISRFLGYSFRMSRHLKTDKFLYEKESLDEIQFNFSNQFEVLPGYVVVQFTIAYEEQNLFPIRLLTSLLTERKCPETCELYLLAYNTRQITFLTSESAYSILCDLINRFSFIIAKSEANLPVYIDEKILNGKIEH